MFYSRPDIDPLGWDLLDLPAPNGSRNFDARTSDGRPIDFRFSSGWLTVERGEPGAPQEETDTETVLSLQISPFGVMDIYPEDLCDILGLTVRGRKISSSELPPQSRGFDWSGRTTYWVSEHRMMYRDDAEELSKKITAAFPGSVLLQPVWGSGLRVRFREIRFMMNTDEMVSIGIDVDRPRLESMLAREEISNEEFESLLPFRIDFSRMDWQSEDLTGKRFINERGAAKLDLNYEVTAHRRYRIWTEFSTHDVRAQQIMKGLLAMIQENFCRGVQIVNLETGEVIGECVTDEEDTKSYSKHFRDWCLQSPNRYLYVGLRSPADGPASTALFLGFRALD
jgi:hypothetical protein